MSNEPDDTDSDASDASGIGAAGQAISGLGRSVSDAAKQLATFSSAEIELGNQSRASAAAQASAVEAQVQAFLAATVKKDAVRALEETAEGIAALAMGDPAAVGHFAAAAVFGSIAGVAAGADAAIGASSGGSPEANASAQSGGGATSSNGASSGPLVINISAGGGLFATAAEVNAGVAKAVKAAGRLQ